MAVWKFRSVYLVCVPLVFLKYVYSVYVEGLIEDSLLYKFCHYLYTLNLAISEYGISN